MATKSENNRTVVACSVDKLDEFRRHVAHAQASGENERTLRGSVDEAMDLLIGKLAKKYGAPSKKKVKLRAGRPLVAD